MATKRQRGNTWEFVVRRRGVLDRPLYLTFDDPAEGDAYCARLEAMLDRGIIPDEIRKRTGGMVTIADVIDGYRQSQAVAVSDDAILGVQRERIGATRVASLDYAWVEAWVRDLKRTDALASSTIRHHVGALARCLDWLARKHPDRFPGNPLRLLPKGYATYNEHDRIAAGTKAPEPDDWRDRRLQPGEEARIRAILAGDKPEGRQRALTLPDRDALVLLFDLALETAMRLSELYTLTWDQVDVPGRTIYLDRTKNGSKRQVPLTSVAVSALSAFRAIRPEGIRVFPWWDGQQTTLSRQRTTSRLSRQFARIFDAAGCVDLRFHDCRHESISRFYERTSLESTVIRKMVGHMSASAHDRYVNLRASTVADRLW
jgi:integrase